MSVNIETQGRAAFAEGLDYNENPYSIYEPDQFNNRLGWAKGWRLARQEYAELRTRAFNRAYEENARRRCQYTCDAPRALKEGTGE